MRTRVKQFETSQGIQHVAVPDLLGFLRAQIAQGTVAAIDLLDELEDYVGPSIIGTEAEMRRSIDDLGDIPVPDLPVTISRARHGLNLLLKDRPFDYVYKVIYQMHGPWIEVDLLSYPEGKLAQYAIWKVTGNVYHCRFGEVDEDPFIVVTEL